MALVPAYQFRPFRHRLKYFHRDAEHDPKTSSTFSYLRDSESGSAIISQPCLCVKSRKSSFVDGTMIPSLVRVEYALKLARGFSSVQLEPESDRKEDESTRALQMQTRADNNVTTIPRVCPLSWFPLHDSRTDSRRVVNGANLGCPKIQATMDS